MVFVRRQNPRPGDRSLDIADPRKTAKTSKSFSMENNQNLKMFLNEKCFSMKNNKAPTLSPPFSASAQQRRNWLFFSKVRNVYLNLPPDGKLSSLELSGEVCEQITQMLKIIRHKGLTIYFWVLLKSGQVDLLLVCNCHKHFKCIHSVPIDFKEIFSQCNLTLWLSTKC